DYCDRFQLSQKLYGREQEIATLHTTFEQVSTSSASSVGSLVLIKGYSGVGKSALVRELYRPMTVKQGHFITGKYDQGQSPIPYQAFSQAFNQLCQYLLTESPEQLAYWRTTILHAAKANGQLLIDIIPDLELIMGAQPPVAALGGQEAQNRFQRVFRNFVQSLAQPDHPLVLFIDDLQWADSASLKLLLTLFENPAGEGRDHSGLMLIGAYRNNEVDASSHPLTHALAAIAQQGTVPITIELDSLPLSAVNSWIADTLDCSICRSGPLAALVYEKTQGNAFFITEFLKMLHADKLLYLAAVSAEPSLADRSPALIKHKGVATNTIEQQFQWQWDIAQIKAQNITDNVVDLMTKKLGDLPL
ncbi:MAG: AAA family ATPase, partial [Cyanobacteria bacterium J06598_3]